MTLVITLLIGGGTLLLVAGIENVSLACSFQWIVQGAPGTPSCSNNPTPTTTTGPQTSTTPPGSVIHNGNPFAGL